MFGLFLVAFDVGLCGFGVACRLTVVLMVV